MAKKRIYDLEERTAKFGEAIIRLVLRITKTTVNDVVVVQLARAGTSIGANYCEADDAESRKDFRHKIGICKKEAREAAYWLRMTTIIHPTIKNEADALRQEAKELNLIFNAIRKKMGIHH